jgi:ankyrin repeat protein
MNGERKMPRWARILLIVLGAPIALLLVVIVVALLIGPPKPSDAEGIARAIINGEVKRAVQAIESGVDVRGSSGRFGSPLHAAASAGGRVPIGEGKALVTGSGELVKLLLAKGADPNARNGQGETPLLKAAASGRNTEVIGLLLAAGADPNALDARRQTPLHWAAVYNAQALPLLLKAGAMPNAANDDGDTPLHHAPTSRDVASAMALVAAGANVNARNKAGQTPLHRAAYVSSNAATIEFLVAKGASVNAADKAGSHPLDYAERQGYPDIVRLLESRGARRSAPPAWELNRLR